MFSTTAIAVTLVALIGCGSPEVEPPPPANIETAEATTAAAAPAREPFKSWNVTLTTSGGFTGRGAGGVSATSSGTLHPTGPLGSMTPGPAVNLPEEYDRIAAATEAADPQRWRASYAHASNPEGCCDQYRYTLRLEIERQDGRKIDFTTYWYDDSGENLPPDLRVLFEALWNTKKKLAAKTNQ